MTTADSTMKVWKIAIKLEIPVLAETAESAIACAEQIPWADLDNEIRHTFSNGQIDHADKLPEGVDKEYMVWVADDSKHLLDQKDADLETAMLLEARIKMGLGVWFPEDE